MLWFPQSDIKLLALHAWQCMQLSGSVLSEWLYPCISFVCWVPSVVEETSSQLTLSKSSYRQVAGSWM